MSAERQQQDHTVSIYVRQLQQRHTVFCKEHEAELRHMSHDFVARFISEHVVFGEKSAYESLLQGMLDNQERDRLHSDPQFTQAWRIFVDLCWLKKQFQRAALILGGIVLVMVVLVLVLFALPHVVRGPAPIH